MAYICKLHNKVNARLNKPEFPCNLVGKVWGQKDCGCDPKELLKKFEAGKIKAQTGTKSGPNPAKNIPMTKQAAANTSKKTPPVEGGPSLLGNLIGELEPEPKIMPVGGEFGTTQAQDNPESILKNDESTTSSQALAKKKPIAKMSKTDPAKTPNSSDKIIPVSSAEAPKIDMMEGVPDTTLDHPSLLSNFVENLRLTQKIKEANKKLKKKKPASDEDFSLQI